MAALSKHDLKAFSKIETFLLGFAGCVFSKIPAGGPTKPWNLCFDSKSIDIEIVYTSDPKQNH